MPISQKLKDLIRSAWEDGSPCLVATYGPNGPNISPKGSMVVFDDDHLAYWERSKKQALENLGHEKRICVMYANFAAQRAGKLESGFLRFYGTAALARERADPRRSSTSCCRASRPTSAPTPGSACWSRSSAPATCGASRCREGGEGGGGASGGYAAFTPWKFSSTPQPSGSLHAI